MGGAVATCVGSSGVTCPQTEGTWLHSGLSPLAQLCDRVCRVWVFVLFFPSVTMGSEQLCLCTTAELLHGGPEVFVGVWTLGRWSGLMLLIRLALARLVPPPAPNSSGVFLRSKPFARITHSVLTALWGGYSPFYR